MSSSRAPEHDGSRASRPSEPSDAEPGLDRSDSTDETRSLAKRGSSQPPVRAGRLARGTNLGRYVVLDPLGEGGAGEVYTAYDPELERKVAIKVLRALCANEELSARMQREAQALARLSHPNVVSVHDVGWVADGRMFLTMELVTGRTLRRWVEETRRDWRKVRDVFVSAGRGLAAAHAAGLVHRDFKPENVLVGVDESVKVTDFGLARAVNDDGPAKPRGQRTSGAPQHNVGALETPLTMEGELMGTPAYMAPEQFMSEATDARTDQFAFCVALYGALYGERPFGPRNGGGPRGFNELADAVLGGKVNDAPAGTKVPAWVRRLLLRGMSTEPDARFACMDELLDALSQDPEGRRRRVVAAVAGAAAVAGLVAFTARQASHAKPAMCTGAQAAVLEVWNDAAKERVKNAFVGSGTKFGPDTWTRTNALLDAYADRWATAHRETCEATRVRGEQPEAVMGLRMACLEQRREQFRTLTSVFAEADRQMVEKAVEAVRSLPSVADCADVTSLMTVAPLPADAGERTTIEAIRREVAQTRALVDAGRYKQALAAAAPLVDRARATGYPPALAEALHVLGVAQERSGSKPDAAASMREAALAAEAGRYDDLKARALVDLVPVLADVGKPESAHETARFAAAGLTRLPDPDVYRAELESGEAWVFNRESKFREAVDGFRRATQLAERRGDVKPILVARLHMRAATALGKVAPVADAIAELDRGDAIVVQGLGPDHPLRVTMYVNKTALLVWEDRPAEAVAAADEGLATAERVLPPNTASFANLLNNRAQALIMMKRYEDGLQTADQASAIADKAFGADSSTAASMRDNRGRSLIGLRRFKEAAEVYRSVLAVYEKALPSDHEWRAEALEALGEAELAQHDTRAAVNHLEDSVGIYQRLKSVARNDLRIAGAAHAFLARALWESGVRSARITQLAQTARGWFAEIGDTTREHEIEVFLANVGGGQASAAR